MRRAMHLGHRALRGLFVAGALLQFFLAGLGVFGTGASFETHATVGLVLVVASVLLLILAGILVFSGDLTRSSAALAALHPVNGVLVLGAACVLAFGLGMPTPAGRCAGRDQSRA